MKTILLVLQLFFYNNTFSQNTLDTIKLKIVEGNLKITNKNVLVTISVLRKRLDNLGYKDSKIEFIQKKNEINITNVKLKSLDIINDFLIKPLKVSFYECYKFKEILERFPTPKSNSQKQFFTLINATDEYLKFRAPSNIGDVMIEDTAKLNRLVKKIKNDLPNDCFMAYQYSDKSTNVYLEYYALKKSKYQIDVNEVLDTAKVSIDYSGRPSIAIVFNNDGAKQFASLTQKNTGNSIAIVIDDFVYSAPFVNGTIEGGKAVISGSFTITETKNFANMLSGGSLLLRLSVIK